jgi:OOP family OmpA-OmpF porin
MIVQGASAAEILTEEDFKLGLVTVVDLFKTADNGIILFDSSSTMGKPYGDSGRPKVEVLKELVEARIAWLPDLGHNMGLYLYTPWTELHPVQPFDRKALGEAIAKVPDKASGEGQLMQAMVKLDSVLAGLKGRTAVFLFSDGQYTPHRFYKRPAQKARELAEKHDVCFYIISTAETDRHRKTLRDIAAVSECSRVLPFNTYMLRPTYNAAALFNVKATSAIVTVMDKKVVGLETEDILFGFDSYDIDPKYRTELNELGEFLQSHAEAFVLIHGFSDNRGAQKYNMMLSRRRAENVAAYLNREFEIAFDRMIVLWDGGANPVASNDTSEGRARNRRVETAVGM